MDEYISRNESINAIKSLESSMPAKDNYAKGYDAALGRALIAVRDVSPVIDVQSAKHGEWEMFYQNGIPKLKCTNCHSLFDIRTNDKHICIYPKFCEECGADMREEK